jgi:hypothetical protein
MHARNIEKSRVLNTLRQVMSENEINEAGLTLMPTTALKQICNSLKLPTDLSLLDRFRNLLLSHAVSVRNAARDRGLEAARDVWNETWPDYITQLAFLVDETVEGSKKERELQMYYEEYVGAMMIELSRPENDIDSDEICNEFDLSDSDEDSEASFKDDIRAINLDEGLSNIRIIEGITPL